MHGEVVDGPPADLFGGAHQLAGRFLVESEGALQVADDVAVLGGLELAVRVGDLEQDRGCGQAHRIVLRSRRLGRRQAALEMIDQTGDAHLASVLKFKRPSYPLSVVIMPKIELHRLSDDSTVWVFGIAPALDERGAAVLLQSVDAFLDQWTAHNVPVTCGRELREGRFLVVAAEATSETSGCSIDKLFGLVRGLELQIGGLDRRPEHDLLSRRKRRDRVGKPFRIPRQLQRRHDRLRRHRAAPARRPQRRLGNVRRATPGTRQLLAITA